MRDVWSLYSGKVMEHFKNPRNVGEIENPDALVMSGTRYVAISWNFT